MIGAGAGLDRFNPVTIWIAGFDWFGRSRRTPFAVLLLIALACLLVFAVAGTRDDWPAGVGILAILGMALVFVPLIGHAMRRLNDLGWSGWWGWLMVVPYAGAVLSLVLCLRPGRVAVRQRDGGLRPFGFALACVGALLIAGRAVWAPVVILSEAMSPTLQAGDLITINTLARTPRRGDVVAFQSDGPVGVMRVVGLPGERVQMRDGRLLIDDVAVEVADDGSFAQPYGQRGPAGVYPMCGNGVVGLGASCETRRAIETLPGGVSHPVLEIGARSLDNTGVYLIPADHYFVLGDNRDNARDSRLPRSVGGPGFVARDDLVGRARLVILSGTGRSLLSVWTWRPDRFLKRVR